MDKPLTTWYCDVCGNPLNVEEGYVVWKNDKNHKAYDFKIIHKGKCDPKGEYRSSLPLKAFSGDEGRAQLLFFLSPGFIKINITKESTSPTYPRIKDFNEYFDLFHRCQTPYYEEARRYFRCKELLECHSDDNEVAPYFPESLKKMIEHFSGICKQ